MKIVIPGNPIPKQRARTIRAGSKTWSYDPQKKEVEQIQWSIKSQMAQEGLKFDQGKALIVSVTFYLPKPVSSSWFDLCVKKPDCSNLVKTYEDAMNGISWHDDCQIVELSIKKVCYSRKPRTEIKIMEKKEFTIDSKAKGILDIFPPEKLEELTENLFTLDAMATLNFSDPAQNDPMLLEEIAVFISFFSDSCYKEMVQVHKKFPGYHKEKAIEPRQMPVKDDLGLLWEEMVSYV